MPHKAYIQTLSAIPQLLNFRNAFVKQRYIFLPGVELIRILSGLGARHRDIKMLQNACSNLPKDPTLPFRRSQMSRFLFDQSSPETPVLRRGEHQPWILSGAEDFVRHDSGKVRHFDEAPETLQNNTAFQALLAFKFFMMQGTGTNFAHRSKLDYGANTDICTAVPIRTTTTPELIGEPALEGVHADGVDFTMTTFIKGSNMTETSAQTLLHTNEQKNATAHHNTLPKHHVAKYQHRNFLDTLLFLDHELKHSLSPVEPADGTKDSHRDMIVFVTRKPCLEGDIRYNHDSLKDHPTMPLSVGMRPGLIPLNKKIPWDHAEFEQPIMPLLNEKGGFRPQL
ncbi:gb [Venturia nashicola]|uniref:Gb n=1 Tax=Venturia nashicola TaxID=86259 RepID=A0A4Z1PK61_9PEZI|nr:gb [Venturia nashicola]TLD38289.1 gb [Venturia nashicola]